MQSASKEALGRDAKNYDWFSYPTNNYGMLTSYDGEATVPKFICDSWNCIDIKDANVPSELNKWLNMNEYAAVGSGPRISLSEKVQRKIGVEALLPELYKVIGISASGVGTGIKTLEISFGPGHIRNLRKHIFANFVPNSSNEQLKAKFRSGDLVYVNSDIVLENFEVRITVDNNLTSQLDAKLNSGNVPGMPTNFNNATLNVKFEKLANGIYSFKSERPLIVARWTKKMEAANVLNSEATDINYRVGLHLTN
jgi:hypothetical protein